MTTDYSLNAAKKWSQNQQSSVAYTCCTLQNSASAAFASIVRLSVGRHNLFLRLCVVLHLCLWHVPNEAWASHTDKQQTGLPVRFARRRLRRGDEGRERVNPSIILTSDPSDSMALPPVEGGSEGQPSAGQRPPCLSRSKSVLNEPRVWKLGVGQSESGQHNG